MINTEKTGGGVLVAGGIIAYFTHPEGTPWSELEIGFMTSGLGAAITYAVPRVEALLLHLTRRKELTDVQEDIDR